MPPNSILIEAIDALASGQDLTADRAAAVLAEIMAGNATEVQTAAVLIALRTKGETVDELAGLAQTMRAFATPVRPTRTDLVDTAGTGGGRATFNVSTTAALVAAAAGCAVAKHGNRSATSRSGSADVLEALGVPIDLEPAAIADSIDRHGFGFMFAPRHHGATRYVVPVRKELAVRTAFNFLGPLTNPAGARRQLIGVSDPAFQATVAGAAAKLGTDLGMVVCAWDGMDELSVSGVTHVIEIEAGELRSYDLQPGDFGLAHDDPDATAGGSPRENADIVRRIFAGEPGPHRDLAVFNAAAAIYIAGRAGSIEEAVPVAQETLDSGAAARTLHALTAVVTA